MVTVIAAFDLDDFVATSCRTRDANRVHRGFGARVGETPHRQAVTFGQHFGDLGIVRARRNKKCANVELLVDRATHERVHMAGEQRAETHVKIGVAIAVDVFHPRTAGRGNNDRIGVVSLKTRRHTEGQTLASPLVGALRTFCALGIKRELSGCYLLCTLCKWRKQRGIHRCHGYQLQYLVANSVAVGKVAPEDENSRIHRVWRDFYFCDWQICVGSTANVWHTELFVVGVAQLARAPGCGPGGRGFKPRRPPQQNLLLFALFFCELFAFQQFAETY